MTEVETIANISQCENTNARSGGALVIRMAAQSAARQPEKLTDEAVILLTVCNIEVKIEGVDDINDGSYLSSRATDMTSMP